MSSRDNIDKVGLSSVPDDDVFKKVPVSSSDLYLFESEYNVGTRVTVAIPARRDDVVEPFNPAPVQSQPGKLGA